MKSRIQLAMWSRGKLSIISAVTVFALFLSALLPLSMAYGASFQSLKDMSPAELELLFAMDEEIVLCTAEGIKSVSLADVQSGKLPTDSHIEYRCVLCYLTATNALLGTSVEPHAIVYPVQLATPLRPADEAVLVRQFVVALLPTRGPPTTA